MEFATHERKRAAPVALTIDTSLTRRKHNEFCFKIQGSTSSTAAESRVQSPPWRCLTPSSLILVQSPTRNQLLAASPQVVSPGTVMGLPSPLRKAMMEAPPNSATPRTPSNTRLDWHNLAGTTTAAPAHASASSDAVSGGPTGLVTAAASSSSSEAAAATASQTATIGPSITPPPGAGPPISGTATAFLAALGGIAGISLLCAAAIILWRRKQKKKAKAKQKEIEIASLDG